MTVSLSTGLPTGAQIGQHLLRDYPGIVPAAVLGGANALSSQSWVQDRARDADDALSGLADLCAADAKCAVAYGVRGLVDAAMALFDVGPVPATYTNPADTATTLSFKIAAEDIADLIFPMQTGQNAVRLLPGFLQSLTSDGVVSLTVVMAPLYGPALLADRCAYPATDGATPQPWPMPRSLVPTIR